MARYKGSYLHEVNRERRAASCVENKLELANTLSLQTLTYLLLADFFFFFFVPFLGILSAPL